MRCLFMLQILIAVVQPKLEAWQRLSNVRGKFQIRYFNTVSSITNYIFTDDALCDYFDLIEIEHKIGIEKLMLSLI